MTFESDDFVTQGTRKGLLDFDTHSALKKKGVGLPALQRHFYIYLYPKLHHHPTIILCKDRTIARLGKNVKPRPQGTQLNQSNTVVNKLQNSFAKNTRNAYMNHNFVKDPTPRLDTSLMHR